MNRRPFLQLLLAALGLRPSASAAPAAKGGDPDKKVPPVPTPTALEAWLRTPIQPIAPQLFANRTEAEVASCVQLWAAIHRRAPLAIRYHGGSEPGGLRTITPALVFHKLDDAHAPPLYVMAWCHRRRGHRTFRLDRIELTERAARAAILENRSTQTHPSSLF